MRTTVILIGLATVAVSAAPAAARDRTGYHAIAAGDLTTAERTLTAERRIFPSRPELMLNLAAVYARTGRAAEAGSLYQTALASDPVLMELPNGTTQSSHDIARRGLAMLRAAVIANR